jgi:hypothetical protein
MTTPACAPRHCCCCSARSALQAKLAVLGDSSSGTGALSSAQAAELASHPAWQRSGFEALEQFIFEFLTGGSNAIASSSSSSNGSRSGAESVRLKLEVGGGWAISRRQGRDFQQ